MQLGVSKLYLEYSQVIYILSEKKNITNFMIVKKSSRNVSYAIKEGLLFSGEKEQ